MLCVYLSLCVCTLLIAKDKVNKNCRGAQGACQAVPNEAPDRLPGYSSGTPELRTGNTTMLVTQ